MVRGRRQDPRILLFAYHEAGRRCVAALLREGWPVAGLVTHPTPPDEADWLRGPEGPARDAGLPVLVTEDPNDEAGLAFAAAAAPDLILSVMFRRLLRRPLRELAALGAFNVHPSLLPRFRGRAPVNWAVLEGATESGVTFHRMVARADAGPIVCAESLPLRADETAASLHRRLLPVFERVTLAGLARVLAGAPEQAQDEAAATSYGGRCAADGAIVWEHPAEFIERLVRAVTRPYPGAFASFDERALFVWRARAEDVARLAPGHARILGERLVVGTGRGDLVLLDWALPDGDRRALLRRVRRGGLVLGDGHPALLKGDAPGAPG